MSILSTPFAYIGQPTQADRQPVGACPAKHGEACHMAMAIGTRPLHIAVGTRAR
jgi:hypothetical protein